MNLSDILKQAGIAPLVGIKPDQPIPSDPLPKTPAAVDAAAEPTAPEETASLAAAMAAPAAISSVTSAPAAATSPTTRLEKAYGDAKKNYAQAFKPLTPEELAANDTERLARQQNLTKALLTSTKEDPEYKQYADTLGKADTAMRDTRAAIAGNRATAGWLSALEKISQALATYSAARYGLDKGVDVVGGMKLEPTDWDRIMQGSIDDLKSELDNLHKEQAAATRGQAGLLEGARSQAVTQASAGNKARDQAAEMARTGLTKQADLGVREAKDIVGADLTRSKEARLSANKTAAVNPADKQLAMTELRTNTKKAESLKKILGDLSSLDAKTITNKNTLQAVKARINQQLAAADIDPTELQRETGWLFKSLEVDPAKAKELINARIQDLTSKNVELQARTRGGVTTSPSAPPAPPAAGPVVLVRKDGARVSVPAEKVQAALATGNYKQE